MSLSLRYPLFALGMLALACGAPDGESDGLDDDTIAELNEPIVNGTLLESDGSHLAVFVRNADGTPTDNRCSGELVTNNWVTTAAHCFAAGQTALLQWSGTGDSIRYSTRIVGNERRDVALIELDRPVPMNGSTSGYSVGLYPWTGEWAMGEPVSLYGWAPTAGSLQLRRGDLVVDIGVRHSIEIFANAAGQAIERGDSGGGAYLNNVLWNGRPMLAAVNSSGPDDMSLSHEATFGDELPWAYKTIYPDQYVACTGAACATTVSALPNDLDLSPLNYQPCTGEWEYQANFDMEQNYDYILFDGVAYTGPGGFRKVKPAGSSLQIRITTDYSVASAGLTLLRARCLARDPALGGRTALRSNGTMIMATRMPNDYVTFGQRTTATGVGSSKWTWTSLGGTGLSQPVVATHLDGRAVVVVRGSDKYLWYRNETSAGSKSFGAWTKMTGKDNKGLTLAGDPAIVRDGSGRLIVFAIDESGELWRNVQWTPDGPWGYWQLLGPPTTGIKLTRSPVIGIHADGGLAVFARGNDGTLWVLRTNEGGYPLYPPGVRGWDWQSIGGSLPDADVIAVGTNADRTLTVMATNTSNSVSYWVQERPSTSYWTYYGELSGVSSAAARPSLASNQDGRLSVFVSADGKLQVRSQSYADDRWWNTSWTALASPITSSPQARQDATGIIHAFALDSSSKLRETLQTASNGTSWTSWSSGTLGGPMKGL